MQSFWSLMVIVMVPFLVVAFLEYAINLAMIGAVFMFVWWGISAIAKSS